MLIGYARVSTLDQNLDLQRDALRQAGCHQVFEEQISGAARKRPSLENALAIMRPGDVLVVWRLDRLGRSLPHLIETIDTIQKRGAGFRSLSESIDTTTAGGRLVFHVMGAIAEFERAMISERTLAGMAAARARHVQIGRPRVVTPKMLTDARMQIARGVSVAKIADDLRVGRSTLYRALKLAEPPAR